jgi:predicted PurR-regulated permease PerM
MTVIIILLLGGVWLVSIFKQAFGALILPALIAFLLAPAVRWLSTLAWLKRPRAAGLVYVLFLLTVAAIPALVGTAAVNRMTQLADEFHATVAAIERMISRPIKFYGFQLYPRVILDNLEQAVSGMLADVPEESLNLLSGITANLLWLLLALVSLYYFLKDGPKIKIFLIGLIPPEYQEDAHRLSAELEDAWGTFLRVQLLIFFVLAVLMGTGILILIWLFRSKLLVFSPLVLILSLIVIFAAAQQVDNLWLRPQLMGSQLHLHPGIVFAGLTVALMVSGVLGAFLAVPLMASAKILGRYIYCQLFDLPLWPDETTQAVEEQQLDEGDPDLSGESSECFWHRCKEHVGVRRRSHEDYPTDTESNEESHDN